MAWSWPRLADAHPPHPQVLDGLITRCPLARAFPFWARVVLVLLGLLGMVLTLLDGMGLL